MGILALVLGLFLFFWRERGVLFLRVFFVRLFLKKKSGFMGLLESELVTGFMGLFLQFIYGFVWFLGFIYWFF